MTGMTHRFSLLTACALLACGTAPSARPASHATAPAAEPTPAEPTPAPAEPPPPPAPPAPPAPRVDAPPTPPRTYDAAACTARVATFRERLQAVVAHVDRFYELTGGINAVAAADADLTAASVIVEVRGSRDEFCAEWGGAWGLTVRAGKRTQRFDGRDRMKGALRAVAKALKPGGRIEVRLETHRAMVPIAPLLVELSKLAPLQLPVAVGRGPYPLPTQDAPPWALERLAAISSLPDSMLEPRQSEAKRAAIDAASSGCPEIAAALRDAVESASSSAHEMARLVPRAVSRCACTNLDVDALEVFLAQHLAGEIPLAERGWIEVRFVEDGGTEVPMSQWPSAMHDLAARPREQRLAGIRIVTAGGQDVRTVIPAGRCD